MKYRDLLRILTFCFAATAAIQTHGQDKSTIGPYNTVYSPFLQRATWSGNQKDTLIRSSTLGYGKNLSIFTTEKFCEFPENPPLIILFDRQFDYITNYLLQSVEYLVSYGQIPRPVVVSIEAGRELNQRSGEARWETDGRGGFGETMDKFVFDELIPFMELNYSIDRNQVIVYGHSWFGYHSSMLLVNRIPQLFAIISASPCCLSSMRIDDIINGIKKDSPALDRKFFYRLTSGHPIGDDIKVYDELVQRIDQLPLPDNFDFRAERLVAATHMEVPGLMFARSLYEIYESWAEFAFQFADRKRFPSYDLSNLYDSLQNCSDKVYGFRIPFYDRHMEVRIASYKNEKDRTISNRGSIATWEFMISRYGERFEWCYNIADCYQILGDKNSALTYLAKAKKLVGNNDIWSYKIRELEKRMAE